MDCQDEVLPISDMQRQEWQLDSLVALLGRPLTSDFRWLRPNRADEDPTVLSTTMLDLSFDVGEFQLVHSRTGACGTRAVAPITATWSTRDDALQAQTRGAIDLDIRDLSWRMHTESNLADASGSLDIPIDVTRPHRGEILSSVTTLKDRDHLGGHIGVHLTYFADRASFVEATTRPASDTGIPGATYDSPVEGYFPILPDPPGCKPGERSVPNSADDPCSQFGTDCSREGKLATSTCEENGRFRVCRCD